MSTVSVAPTRPGVTRSSRRAPFAGSRRSWLERETAEPRRRHDGCWTVQLSWPIPLARKAARVEGLFGPGVVEDDVDEVLAGECRVEVREHVVVDGAEGALRAVLHSVVERGQDALLEIRTRMSRSDGGKRSGRK